MTPLPCCSFLKFCSFNLIQFSGFQAISSFPRCVQIQLQYILFLICVGHEILVWCYALWRIWKEGCSLCAWPWGLAATLQNDFIPKPDVQVVLIISCFLRKLKQKLTVSECSSVTAMGFFLSAFCPPDGST